MSRSFSTVHCDVSSLYASWSEGVKLWCSKDPSSNGVGRETETERERDGPKYIFNLKFLPRRSLCVFCILIYRAVGTLLIRLD